MIEQNTRRTKVIKSFEGRGLNAAEAEKVAKEEVDVLRVVYSPKSAQAVQTFLEKIRQQRHESHPLPVMLDISGWNQGSIGPLEKPVEVSFGEKIQMGIGGQSPFKIVTEKWPQILKVPSKVFVGAGNVVLKTIKIQGDVADFEVLQGGAIYPEMELAIPDTWQDMESNNFTAETLKPLLQHGVDYVLVHGQWPSDRIVSLRDDLTKSMGVEAPWILAKVDSDQVIERLPKLLPVVDGVMISRRELALTVNPSTVPMLTKQIIQQCNDYAKIVLTASEMLASMRRNFSPTRAEALDVANAVLDGTDAVVLSEEVTNGKYSAEAVEVMHRVIRDIETYGPVVSNWLKQDPKVESEMDAVAYHAYRTAERVKAKAIVTITQQGNTALKLASYRAPVPIIAVTFSEAVRRRLAIVRGVQALKLDVNPQLDDVLPTVNEHLVRHSWLKAGDPIVFVSITLSSVGRESSNLFSVQILS
jgi:pyruvate kinase